MTMKAEENATPFGPAVEDDEAWQAVLTRDARYDGRFVYAVATTGVYCRPVCAARRPNRRNVSFYDTPDDAEHAGFRACRRCRPSGSGPSAALRSVERARAWIEQNLDRNVTLDELGRVAHMSPFHLQRTFKQAMGVSPHAWARARRAERLKAHLRDGESVGRATYRAGYGSSSRVYEQADARLGMTPATYRRGGQGMKIRFSTTDSRLGRVLVAETERGVCAVHLGGDDVSLEAELRAEYPRAKIDRAAGDFSAAVDAIVGYLSGALDTPDLPIDVQATAFQQRVWQALQDIPRGSTRSYSEIAEAIGRPTAARAVARACASNRVALVIPCHRVVRQDGAAGGYRWGVERKRRLLELEREPAGRS